MHTELKCGNELKAMNPIMQLMFVGFVEYAMKEADIRVLFETETGMIVPVAQTPIDRMIDAATGVHEAWAATFIDWVWERLWAGDPEVDHLADPGKMVGG